MMLFPHSLKDKWIHPKTFEIVQHAELSVNKELKTSPHNLLSPLICCGISASSLQKHVERGYNCSSEIPDNVRHWDP